MHTDSLRGILGSFEHYCARTFWSAICTDIDVSTNDVARGTEEILKILPPSLVRQLHSNEKVYNNFIDKSGLTLPT